MQSPTWHNQAKGGLKMVFSSIVTMLETALKSISTATPTKLGVLQYKGIHNFDDEVWSKVYKLMDESIRVGGDDDMNEVFGLS